MFALPDAIVRMFVRGLDKGGKTDKLPHALGPDDKPDNAPRALGSKEDDSTRRSRFTDLQTNDVAVNVSNGAYENLVAQSGGPHNLPARPCSLAGPCNIVVCETEYF